MDIAATDLESKKAQNYKNAFRGFALAENYISRHVG
jgi:hypothetical protein